ncbi:H-NS histone family protein [Caballeronia insecticola]|uniref:H-NS histone family protein n=1 Tax=Caballeronia insecticola TaxID=758793 RepID=UPI001E51609B|nr:H-NS histone family protein [Caballeronia insecticola]
MELAEQPSELSVVVQSQRLSGVPVQRRLDRIPKGACFSLFDQNDIVRLASVVTECNVAGDKSIVKNVDPLWIRNTMATLFQIEQRIANLQKKADELRRKQSTSVIQSIKRMMDKHGISVEDLRADMKSSSAGKEPDAIKATRRNSKAAGSSKGKLPPKYRDPKTGATWSGHARPPVWIRDAKDRAKFLIDASSE